MTSLQHRMSEAEAEMTGDQDGCSASSPSLPLETGTPTVQTVKSTETDQHYNKNVFTESVDETRLRNAQYSTCLTNEELQSKRRNYFRRQGYISTDDCSDISTNPCLLSSSNGAESTSGRARCRVALDQSPLGNVCSPDDVPVECSSFSDSFHHGSLTPPEDIPKVHPFFDDVSQEATDSDEAVSGLLHAIYRQPLSLIQANEHGHLHLNQNTLVLLNTLDTPIVVLAIVGRSRRGKSYLMNYLAGRKSGFQVCNTVETCTRGIWIWCFPHPMLPDTTLVLMDTEGLEGPDKGDDNFDAQVIVLSLLLSSTFIYNTQGSIDNSLIKQLGLVCRLANHLIQVRREDEKTTVDASLHFPMLFVVIRDFHLELRKGNTPVTPDEYFEHCIKEKQSENKSEAENKEYNDPRRNVSKFFPVGKHYCCTLPHPNRGTSKDDFNPDFLVQVEAFKKRVLSISKQKTFGLCDKVTGRMFATMAQEYVSAIANKEIPCIQSVFHLTAIQENRRILKLALAEYRAKMQELLRQNPLSQDQLYQKHQQLMRDLLDQYRKKIIFEEAHDFKQEYEDGVSVSYNEMLDLNEQNSRDECEKILKELNETIASKLSRGEYFCAGGYAFYNEDLQILKAKYLLRPNKGVKSDIALFEFLQRKKSEIDKVIAADKEMSVQRVQEEAEKQRKLEAKLRESVLFVAKEREQLFKNFLMENQVALQREMEQRLEEQQKEMEERLEEQKTLFESVLKEREEAHSWLVKKLAAGYPMHRVCNIL